MEFLILFLMIFIFIIYYSYIRVEKENDGHPTSEKYSDKLPRKSRKSQKYAQQGENKILGNEGDSKEKKKRIFNIEETTVINNIKELIITSFREGKDLYNVHICNEGKLILTSDEKRINLFLLNSLHEKNPKCYTKNLDNDVITDITICDKKQIAVGLKNTKEIIFYELQKNKQDNKLRLQKIEKKVLKSDHKFEINKILFTKDGCYLATSGINQDTKIHIYNGNTLQKLESIDINEIQNIDMKFSKDEKYLTTSTYMYEIGVIDFKITTKFNKNNNTEEKITRIEKNRSIGNIKYPIISYDFCNENNFFVLSSSDKKIKIFQSYASIEDAKILKEINVDYEDENFLPSAENVTMYVLESRKNEFDGIIACSYENNIFIFSSNGNLIKYFPKAHETDIIKMKILKDNDSVNVNDLALISVSKDGRIYITKIN